MDLLRAFVEAPPSATEAAPTLPGSITTPTASKLPPVLLSIDLEAFEHNQSLITEVGISTLDLSHLSRTPTSPSSWLPHIHSRHIIITEHAHLINKRYVTGCPKNFHGTSTRLSLAQAAALTQRALAAPGALLSPPDSAERDVILVAHGLAGDKSYLSSLGVMLDPASLAGTVDTQRLASTKARSVGLARLLDVLGVQHSYLHNAGNDAMYTLQACVRMWWLEVCGGEEEKGRFREEVGRWVPSQKKGRGRGPRGA